jgi:hypothetical protein
MPLPAIIAALGSLFGASGAAAGTGAAVGGGTGALGGTALSGAAGTGVGQGVAGLGASGMGGGAPGMSTLMGGEVGAGTGQGLWTDLISPDTPTPAAADPWYKGLLDGTGEAPPLAALPEGGPKLHANPVRERKKRQPSQFTMPASLRTLMGG